MESMQETALRVPELISKGMDVKLVDMFASACWIAKTLTTDKFKESSGSWDEREFLLYAMSVLIDDVYGLDDEEYELLADAMKASKVVI